MLQATCALIAIESCASFGFVGSPLKHYGFATVFHVGRQYIYINTSQPVSVRRTPYLAGLLAV